MNEDQIRGLWAPLSPLTFIWASLAVIYVYSGEGAKEINNNKKEKQMRQPEIIIFLGAVNNSRKECTSDLKKERKISNGWEREKKTPLVLKKNE